MTYNPKFLIDTLFNAGEDFSDYAELAQQPITIHQTIAKAYLLLNKTGRFKQAITEWNHKPAIKKTWPNFKTHFRQAHQEFRETTDISLEESELACNNANLVQQVVDGLQSALTPDETLHNESAELIAQMAHSATRSNETQQQLAAQLAQMQQAMALLQTQVQQQHHTPYQQNYQQHYQPTYAPRGGGQYQQDIYRHIGMMMKRCYLKQDRFPNRERFIEFHSAMDICYDWIAVAAGRSPSQRCIQFRRNALLEVSE
jgi:hypothetical protein